MIKINSRSNEKIKHFVRLGESASLRSSSGEFVLEGARLCADAAQTGIVIKQVFFTAQAAEKYTNYLDAVAKNADEVFEISSDVASKLSDTQSAQGIFCVCAMPDDKGDGDIDPHGRYLALENVQDPSNFGAICRTAEALGISGIIVSGGCDIFNPKALRAAMGSSLRLNIIRSKNIIKLLIFLKEKGMLTVASTPQNDACDIRNAFDGADGIVCVIGNEGSGVTPQTMETCDKRVTIPMGGRAESLNAASAASIIAWELVKGV